MVESRLSSAMDWGRLKGIAVRAWTTGREPISTSRSRLMGRRAQFCC